MNTVAVISPPVAASCFHRCIHLNRLHLPSQALVNSTITANMNFTKTSPKFGQWSDHRANTVYGLGFSNEKDLVQVCREGGAVLQTRHRMLVA